MIQPLIAAVEQQYTKDKVPDFQIGDTVAVHVRIREGDKVRTQQFKGDVIARRGRGVGETFTVRHIDPNSQGVERIFPIHSPNVGKIEVTRSGKVRRAKLYFLRDRIGKARKLKEKRRVSTKKKASAAAKAPKTKPAPEPVEAEAAAAVS